MTTTERPSSTSVGDWPAARTHPFTYPGDHPEGSFVVIDDEVHRISLERPGELESARIEFPDGAVALDPWLHEHGLAPLRTRVPLVAYGGNRNPGTIALKADHYRHDLTNRRVSIALQGSLHGVDVVAGGLSDQGYLYADLYAGPECADTSAEAWILLLDHEGLRVMNDSEGLQIGGYACAVLDDVRVDGLADDVRALAYVSELPIFVSPTHGTPIAYRQIRATGRALPEMDTPDMLEHALTSLGLDDEVRRLTGVRADHPVGDAAMRFLNGQFWFRRHTLLDRLESCAELEMLIWGALLGSCTPRSTAAILREHGVVLDTETAYHPPAELLAGTW